MLDVRVTDDPAAVVAELLADALAAGGQVALAGGSSPRRAYELLAQSDADLAPATLWLGDERMVAPDDPRSNLAMIRAALIDRLHPARRPALRPVDTTLEPAAAADAYDALLRTELVADALDLALLGLGPDAHTASLFPGKPALAERERFVVAVPEAGMEPYVPRVTLTLPALTRARAVIFLVAGAEKADAVRRAFGPTPDPRSPAAQIRPATLICDVAAAEGLR